MTGARVRGGIWLTVLSAWGAGLLALGRTAWSAPSPLEQKAAAVVREADLTRDLEYARPKGKSLKLDLYRPRGFSGSLPTVVFIHGGGWTKGDKARPVPAVLVGFGYAVASINYRLATDAPFPAQIQDCKAAVRWLRAHAREYRLNSDRVGVWGSSAGGHLAALLALSPDRPEWEVGENLEQSSQVQAACDFFGPTDLTEVPSGPLAKQQMALVQQLVGGPPEQRKELTRAASPLFHVTPAAPPFFIAHGIDDDLVSIAHSRKLYRALRERQVPAELLEVRRAGHGFSKDSDPPQGQIYLQVLKHFNRYLKEKP